MRAKKVRYSKVRGGAVANDMQATRKVQIGRVRSVKKTSMTIL